MMGPMEHVVRDAAAPLGAALATLLAQRGHVWRPRDVAISYSGRGMIAVIADRVADDEYDQIKAEFMTAFAEAGWEVGVWSLGRGLTMQHPSQRTRLSSE